MRFDADRPGEWSSEAIPCWTDPRSDLAVLTISARTEEAPVAVARFGRISDRPAVLAARAVGFPRFKLKSDDGPVVFDDEVSRYRDSHQADGSVAVLSNRREGTLEVTMPPPERDPDPAVSPWEGMSGAAVWIGDRIVGVIARHHRSDGLGRLTAGRLDLALENLDPDRQASLRMLLSLPDMLPDVVQPSTSKWRTTGYQRGSRRAIRSHRRVILSSASIGILLVGLVVTVVLMIFSVPGPLSSASSEGAPKLSCSEALQVSLALRNDGSRDGAPIVNVRTCIQLLREGDSAIIEAASESGSLRSILVSWRIELHSCRTGAGIIARDYVPPDEYFDTSKFSKATPGYRDPEKPDEYFSNGRILSITVVDASGEKWNAGQMKEAVRSPCSG